MSGSLAMLLAAIVLVPLAGLFAALDAALSTVSHAQVAELARNERPGAPKLLEVVGDRPRYVNLLVLLRVACEATATVLVAVAVASWVSTALAVLIAAAVMAVVSYVVIGVGPRTLGRQHAYRIGLVAAAPLKIFGTVLDPLSKLLILVGNAITPGRGFRQGPFSSEVELRELVDMAQQGGVVDAGERRMIQSVFDLGDTIAREVMVPRTDMIWIEQDKTMRQAMSLAVRSGHSRIPVVGEGPDDVLGIVFLKDLVQRSFTLRDGERGEPVRELMREAVFVPDSKTVDELLSDMQLGRHHMAILVDEYGGVAGLITIEDILEEIVGEIADEYDTDERPPVEYLDDGAVRVSARLSVEDLGEVFGIELPAEDVESVGGLLGQVLGRVPLPGSEVTTHGLVLRAEAGPEIRGRVRVGTVVVRRDQPDDGGEHHPDRLHPDRSDGSDRTPELTSAEDRSPYGG
ncbi:hemolysin family protein [Rhodococcus sp. X156]|uniref:hemolysin family protein n=1 Tax=Rhodococcus sp. X156 TaxID=2499145 RepID=UPI000FDAB737|nr:hemolysin family protein [Rhodococcus sp. X156]